jgi:hypothetical protein
MPCSTVCLSIAAALLQGIVAAATLCFMQCWGINIQPLLAVGSIGTGDAGGIPRRQQCQRPRILFWISVAHHLFVAPLLGVCCLPFAHS